jgi:hypothetical protein
MRLLCNTSGEDESAKKTSSLTTMATECQMEVEFPATTGTFLSLRHQFQTNSGVHQASPSVVTKGTFSG